MQTVLLLFLVGLDLVLLDGDAGDIVRRSVLGGGPCNFAGDIGMAIVLLDTDFMFTVFATFASSLRFCTFFWGVESTDMVW